MFAWINRLDRYVPIRYASWALCLVGFALALAGWIVRDWPIWPAIVFALDGGFALDAPGGPKVVLRQGDAAVIPACGAAVARS